MNFTVELRARRRKVWATSVIFNKPTQGKQSPKRRKFSQPGHPGEGTTLVAGGISEGRVELSGTQCFPGGIFAYQR
jgi:hypothetical protein